LPTWAVSRLAAERVKVVLGGDGADELWGGYPTLQAHRAAAVFARLPSGARALVARAARRLPVRASYQPLEWKLRRFVLRWDDDPIVRHLRWMSSADLADLAALTRNGPRPPLLDAPPPRTGDLTRDILALDFATYLPGSVLAKVDRASMAHGLEVRPPFLANEMVRAGLAAPAARKLRGFRTKDVLRRAARAHLPRAITRRRKHGFGIPLGAWLRGPLLPLLEDALGDPRVEDAGLDRAVARAWAARLFAREEDRAKPLWALVVLVHWMRRTP
jgi:asparagine synthase (glutamine-hydrolysing)